MTTLSFKRAMSLLTGLFLVVSLICVSAAGQGKGKKGGNAGSKGIAATTATGDLPTLTTPYFCVYTINGSEPRYSTLIMNYTKNMPGGAFLGQNHTILIPAGTIQDKDTQVYNPRPQSGSTPQTTGTLWSFQHQDGSVVCKEMFVTSDKRLVKFSQCSNTAVQTCNAY
jgi:hypothetical protein